MTKPFRTIFIINSYILLIHCEIKKYKCWLEMVWLVRACLKVSDLFPTWYMHGRCSLVLFE